MIQDIYPSVYDNRYKIASPMADARICAFDGDGVLAKIDAGRIRLPRYEELCAKGVDFCYIFHVDDGDYFLAFCEQPLQVDGYSYLDIRSFLTWNANPDAFSMITAYQLHNWYAKNRFCGRCGAALARGTQERSLVCRCGHILYPSIAPAIVVGVTHRDRLLLTKYAGRNAKNYALIAGFCEIGESLEDTVRREVREEVGLAVKNITYYKSQPWALTSCLLAGFFAELDGEEHICLEQNELCEAQFFPRQEIHMEDDGVSLTREMISHFVNQT